MSDGVDRLIKEYLERKGYVAAAKELDNALQSASDPPSKFTFPLPEQRHSILRDMLLSQSNIEYNYNNYMNEYVQFISFINHSLNTIKRDLQSICFPLFVISYINILKKEGIDNALLYWTSFQAEHYLTHSREMHSLSQLTDISQLTNESFLIAHPFM
jgi:hypothetical protein